MGIMANTALANLQNITLGSTTFVTKTVCGVDIACCSVDWKSCGRTVTQGLQ